MRRLKNTLILLLTAGMIALGAALPKIVASAMNRETCSQSGTRDMVSIALEMDGEKRSLSSAEKIDLLRRGQMINVTEKEAAMTVEDVNAAVERAMEEYIDAGIFEWFDFDNWITETRLCIDPDTPENYGVFWTVTIVNNEDPYQTLGVDVDDETGKIYSIRYDTYGEYSLKNVWERNRATMDAFSHIYLKQLGFMEDPGSMGPNLEYGELDGEVLCGTFCTADAEYGEMYIEFYVTGSGSFWVYFPE